MAQQLLLVNLDRYFDFHAACRRSLGSSTPPKVDRKFLFILANHKNGDGHGSQPRKIRKSQDEKVQKIQRTVADKPKSVRYSVALSVRQLVIKSVCQLVSRSAKRLRVQVFLSVAAQIPPALFSSVRHFWISFSGRMPLIWVNKNIYNNIYEPKKEHRKWERNENIFQILCSLLVMYFFYFLGFCIWLISVAPGKWKCLGLRPQLSKVEFPLNTRSTYATHNPTSISISRL